MSIFSNNRLRLFGAAIGLGLATACGGFRNGGEAGGDLAAVLYFTNESLDQATVYAVTGTQQVRIGTVMSNRTDTLTVPASVLGGAGTFQLVARPLASNRIARSGPISLSPGDELVVRLPSTQNTLVILPSRP